MSSYVTRFAAAVCAVLLLAAAATAQTGPKFGFIDIEKIINEYQKTKTIAEELRKESDQALASLQAQRDRIRSMEGGLDLYEEGTKEWLELAKQVKVKQAELELDMKSIRVLFDRKLADYIRKIYVDILEVVKDFSRTEGYAAIFMYSEREPAGRTEREVINSIVVRPVVYRDPNLDVTQKILARLNK